MQGGEEEGAERTTYGRARAGIRSVVAACALILQERAGDARIRAVHQAERASWLPDALERTARASPYPGWLELHSKSTDEVDSNFSSFTGNWILLNRILSSV